MAWFYKNEAEQGLFLLNIVNGIISFQIFVAIFYIVYCFSLGFGVSDGIKKKGTKKTKPIEEHKVTIPFFPSTLDVFCMECQKQKNYTELPAKISIITKTCANGCRFLRCCLFLNSCLRISK